jgi:glycosyltransferase involved in cell wall biosynthesis
MNELPHDLKVLPGEDVSSAGILTRTASASSQPPQSTRICIVTGEFAGPDFNGGIGTTNRALALVLRAHGYVVDILYTRVDEGVPFSTKGTFLEHVNAYARLGIRLLCIPHDGAWNDWQSKSYLAMQHLLQRHYDVVFFDDTHGTAYYPLLAKKSGHEGLQRTVMCVTAHSATQWIYDLNQTQIKTFAEVRLMEMERRSIELADICKAPSAYILRKYHGYGWNIPPGSVVLPNFIAAESSAATEVSHKPIDEIVFFGRLETRKGLWMFCRALDLLKFQLRDKTVTFLGKPTDEHGVSTANEVIKRAASWPFQVRLLTNFDRDQALSYLRLGNRLAVIASPEDNSPSAILECLSEGIPFIACHGSGGEELLAPESRDHNLCAPNARALKAKLREAIEHGMRTARRSFTQADLDDRFHAWLENLLEAKTAPQSAKTDGHTGSDLTLLLIVPTDVSPEAAVSELTRAYNALDPKISIEVLTSCPAVIRKTLQEAGLAHAFGIHDTSHYGELAASFAHRPNSVLAVSRVGQIPDRTLFERVERAFALTPAAALTVMVQAPEVRVVASRQPFFSRKQRRSNVARYLMGNASALFPLVQETNAGLVFFRSDAFVKLQDVTPFDSRYARFKLVEDWLHECLVHLSSLGEQFDVLPDVLAGPAPDEPSFEVFRLTGVMRSIPERLYGFEPGSDRFLLARLSIDTGMSHERSRAVENYLSKTALRVGARMPDRVGLSELATLAHANGQVELAIDLSASSGMQAGPWKGLSASELVRLALNTVHLADIVKKGAFRTLNIDDSSLMKLNPDAGEIEFHANPANKGIAAVVFPSVDLVGTTRFSCTIGVPQTHANPIRFRIELASLDKKHQWPMERVVRGGETMQWEVDIPEALRRKCKLLLGVEMADPDDSSEAAFARWTHAQFFQAPPAPGLTS